jgi:hypothetical protein
MNETFQILLQSYLHQRIRLHDKHKNIFMNLKFQIVLQRDLNHMHIYLECVDPRGIKLNSLEDLHHYLSHIYSKSRMRGV